MSYSSESSTSTSNSPLPDQPHRTGADKRKLFLTILTIALLGTWGFIIYDKSRTNQEYEQLQAQYTNVDSARSALVIEFEDARRRMDSLVGSNTELTGELAERQGEINRLKDQVAVVLKQKNVDAKKARSLINQLKAQVNDLMAEVERLRDENQVLTAANQHLTAERDSLNAYKQSLESNLNTTRGEKAHLEEVGSTFNVSNINIAAINVKNSGKEVTTSSAKRADALRISFVIDENRIASTGTKEIYVTIIDPSGNPVSVPQTSGTFKSREEGEKVYTSKVMVNYEKGKRTPVSFDWKQDGRYQTGDYKIQIYHNGYKIGEAVKALKKTFL